MVFSINAHGVIRICYWMRKRYGIGYGFVHSVGLI